MEGGGRGRRERERRRRDDEVVNISLGTFLPNPHVKRFKTRFWLVAAILGCMSVTKHEKMLISVWNCHIHVGGCIHVRFFSLRGHFSRAPI